MHEFIDKMDSETIERIASETIYVNPGENEYRHGRITASSCGKYLECYKKSCQDDPVDYLRSVYAEKHVSNDEKAKNANQYMMKCLEHGIRMENTAKDAFSEKLKDANLNHKLYKAGFYVDSIVGIFGCTPDGILEFESDGSKALLEVKCPYSVAGYRDIKTVCRDPRRKQSFELAYDEATDTFSLQGAEVQPSDADVDAGDGIRSHIFLRLHLQ